MKYFILLFVLSVCSSVYGGEKHLSICFLPPEIKNCGANSAAGILEAVKENISVRLDSSGITTALQESINDIMFVGGSTSAEALLIKKLSPSAPDIAIAVCVEGSLENTGDSAFGRYRIIMRVLSTPEMGVSYAANSEWLNKRELIQGVQETSLSIIKYLNKISNEGENNTASQSIPISRPVVHHSGFACYSVFVPVGSFSSVTGAGYGASVHYGYQGFSLFNMSTSIRSTLSLAVFRPSRENVKSLKSATFLLGAGPLFKTDLIAFIPHAGIGVFVSEMQADIDGQDISGRYYFKSRKYIDPALYASIDAVVQIGFISVFLQSSCLRFYEKGNTGNMFLYSFGAGYKF